MTTKEKIKLVLEKWKFPILNEDERLLVFRYQMSYVQVSLTIGEESDAMAVTLAGLFTADNDAELNMGLKACNDLNYHLLQVKLYIDSDNDLVIASETFHQKDEDLEFALDMSLRSLISAKKRFIEKYRELEDEAKLNSLLSQESAE